MKFCEWLGSSKEKLNWYEQLEKSKEPLEIDHTKVSEEKVILVKNDILANIHGKMPKLKPSPATFYPLDNGNKYLK